MSKKSVYHRNLKRIYEVKVYRERRMKLKKQIKDQSLTGQQRFAAVLEIQKLPKNASPVRVRNRCYLSGRARGIMPKFGLSRIWFRKLANQNQLPGIVKSSW